MDGVYPDNLAEGMKKRQVKTVDQGPGDPETHTNLNFLGIYMLHILVLQVVLYDLRNISHMMF